MAHVQFASNDNLDYERIGRFIFSFHRVCGSVEGLAEPRLVRNAPRELAQRASDLSAAFHRIINNPASISENEIESTLRKATEVQAEIDRWRAEDRGP
jgi:uncharacterized membrane protein